MSSTSVGTANSGVPMKTRRRLTLVSRFRNSHGCLYRFQANFRIGTLANPGPSARLFQTLRLCELLEGHRALEARKMIDKQNAFEVIDFVLQTGGEQSLRLQLLQTPLAVEIFGPDLRRPLDLFPYIRNRETAF